MIDDTPKPTGKLWGKLLMATQNMADRIPSRDDKGPGKLLCYAHKKKEAV
jgi:hypothetical protein